MPSKKIAWIEGIAEAKDIIFKLADEIIEAELPDSEPNRWKEAWRAEDQRYVEYEERFRTNTSGLYRHTDGKTYPVYRLTDNRNLVISGESASLVDPGGFVHEVYEDNTKTGKRVQVRNISYVDEQGVSRLVSVAGLLVVNVDDPTDPIGKKCHIVQQVFPNSDGTFTSDNEWNSFKIVAEMPDDWNYVLSRPSVRILANYRNVYGSITSTYLTAGSVYTFTERHYIPTFKQFDSTVVLKASPEPVKEAPSKDFYVMMTVPRGQYNYFSVIYGEGFVGSDSSGDPQATYRDICDPNTVRPGVTPVIISQVKACEYYRNSGGTTFTPPVIRWGKDIDGVTDVASPPSYYFYGSDSTVTWLSNKKRRADYWVRYYLSVNNDRVAMVIEGDPAPDISGYYRSFAYIGKIESFNDHDYLGNFAVTTGMGDLELSKTGMVATDIKQESNPKYAGFGRYTSNGMYSVSMLRTASNVLFQAHYPAFLTQLPNYSGVGTVPPTIKKMVLDPLGYQPSAWTAKYHASPIYLVHQTEGYRGYMGGVVAINDHNLINTDELVVDTGEPKDPNDPTQGNWIEVYKFFSINTPVNMFKFSANPDEVTIAILKEIK